MTFTLCYEGVETYDYDTVHLDKSEVISSDDLLTKAQHPPLCPQGMKLVRILLQGAYRRLTHCGTN